MSVFKCQRRVITSGQFAGQTVMVSDIYDSPSQGRQVVLQVRRDDAWHDFVRASEQEVEEMTRAEQMFDPGIR